MPKYVYFFGAGQSDGKADMKELLGGKGANLAEMASLGIPVPPGFTITTEVCEYYYKNSKKKPSTLAKEIDANLKKLEDVMEAKLGDKNNPLLVSVRSGAAVSMPGMMDTVLNLGLNDDAVEGLATKTGNERMAWDSYRRFINMFGDVVMGVSHDKFEEKLSAVKKKYGRDQDTDLTVEELKEVVDEYKKVYKKNVKKDFPTDAKEQLGYAIDAVIGSWNTDRAIAYRNINKMEGLKGTAVNVQAMVFGNMGDNSGTGVAFTRNPSDGTNVFFGEYLINAQGEDVVAGIRTPEPISTLKKKMPEIYAQLDKIRLKLEKHYKDMQDLEFTIQEGKLFMLQTRTGKRTGIAAVKMAYDMVKEKLINDKTALLRIEGDHINQLLFPVFDKDDKAKVVKDRKVMTRGLPAGPGAASGVVAFSADEAVKLSESGKKVILVRKETSPEDVSGMWAAEAIVTSTGGMTSHAAVVARGWGKCCVVGAGELKIDYDKKTISVNKTVVGLEEEISVDGYTGEIIAGHVDTEASPVVKGLIEGDKEALKNKTTKMFQEIMSWADKYRKINVRTNSDSPKDSSVARAFGAEGIGLCRTEHMFFEGERIWSIRKMILASSKEEREIALSELLPYQKEDFEGIFRAMDGYPVTVRLLDPPLHEFLPHDSKGQKEMAEKMGVKTSVVKNKVEELKEANPMLGHRGCRLSITYPEIPAMQTRAIMEAACKVAAEGIEVFPEIMIPLIGTVSEFVLLEKVIRSVAEEVLKEKCMKIKYKVGTMIEIPRAAFVADRIAEHAEFFSFGTNDLTQMTFGYSRDDIGSFLPDYLETKILMNDPFATIDRRGVGQFVKMGIEKGRATKKSIKCGVCGEHGGDPRSVKFFNGLGVNYVSCSPFRVPIAILASAQSEIERKAELRKKK